MNISHCIVITITVIGVDSIIIDEVVIIIAVGALCRFIPIAVIMEQIHQCQPIGINVSVNLIF